MNDAEEIFPHRWKEEKCGKKNEKKSTLRFYQRQSIPQEEQILMPETTRNRCAFE